MAEKVIIIGGTAAGLSAASKAKRVDPSLEITVFERSGYISYGACGLPYFVGGIIDQPDDGSLLHLLRQFGAIGFHPAEKLHRFVFGGSEQRRGLGGQCRRPRERLRSGGHDDDPTDLVRRPGAARRVVAVRLGRLVAAGRRRRSGFGRRLSGVGSIF